MVVKVKEYFKKTRQVKNNNKSKNIFYEEKERQDIMSELYLRKRNLIISILILIQHNCIFSRLSTVQKSI